MNPMNPIESTVQIRLPNGERVATFEVFFRDLRSRRPLTFWDVTCSHHDNVVKMMESKVIHQNSSRLTSYEYVTYP